MTDRSQVAVLGAGFGGLAVAHRLAAVGVDDVVIFERDQGVGGTWRANRYPGAACDVPSHLYSLSFAPNPYWSRTYATQPEILAYLEDCYDRFGVRDKVRLGVDVAGLRWVEERACWELRDRGGAVRHEASVVVTAVGMFHTPKVPDLAGLDDFAGTVVHSARWDDAHDVTGERVAVVGTGASAIQIVPAVAERTAHLDLYQRSAPWILPRRDEPYLPEQQRAFADDPALAAAHRQQFHDLYESSTAFLTGDPTGDLLASIARDHLARAVADPELRAALTPRHPFGCTRPLLSNDYYLALQRPDVELVTTGIDRVTPGGLRTVDGVERPADTIVLCTGFHAADHLRGISVEGRDGTELHDRWAGRPRAFHGMAVPGFPNLFLLYGPNTNQGGNSILLILEAQADLVARLVEAMGAEGAAAVEVGEAAMAGYEADLERDLRATVWADGCTTYFHGATGDVVTQLPHTSGWYRSTLAALGRDDFVFGGVACTTS